MSAAQYPGQSSSAVHHDGYYELKLDKPADFSRAVQRNLAEYVRDNKDIGVIAHTEGKQVVGFYVWAKETGAGYSYMDDDIKGLAKQPYATTRQQRNKGKAAF